MKLKTIALIVVLAWLMANCTKQDAALKPGTYSDLSSFAKNFVGMNSSVNMAMAPSRSGAINQSFNGMINGMGGNAGVTFSGDSTMDPYNGCAKISEKTNPDGSTTVVTDYGTGCTQTYNDWQSTVWGKNTYTYKNSTSQKGSVFSSTYYYRSLSDNFGGRTIYQGDTSTWLSNGHSTSSGNSLYDTTKNTYSGYNSYSDTSDFKYNKQLFSYMASGKYSYSNQKSVQEVSSYRYTDGKNYYQAVVTVPIVRDYSCNQNKTGAPNGIMYIQVPISGHEIVKYSQDGVEGEFEIDYGNGACDTLITIIENGKSIVIDLGSSPVVPMKG